MSDHETPRHEMSDDARDAMSLPPRDKGRRIGVQIGRWFIGVSREPEAVK